MESKKPTGKNFSLRPSRILQLQRSAPFESQVVTKCCHSVPVTKQALAPEANFNVTTVNEAAPLVALFIMLDNDPMKSRDRKSSVHKPEDSVPFDANLTQAYQVKLKNRAPRWFASVLAGNQREKFRLRSELGNLKDAIPLLMKQRNGGKWTVDERKQLRGVLRSASQVSPYLLIWVIPGSMVFLPLLAWFLDVRRKHRDAKQSK